MPHTYYISPGEKDPDVLNNLQKGHCVTAIRAHYSPCVGFRARKLPQTAWRMGHKVKTQGAKYNNIPLSNCPVLNNDSPG